MAAGLRPSAAPLSRRPGPARPDPTRPGPAMEAVELGRIRRGGRRVARCRAVRAGQWSEKGVKQVVKHGWSNTGGQTGGQTRVVKCWPAPQAAVWGWSEAVEADGRGVKLRHEVVNEVVNVVVNQVVKNGRTRWAGPC